MKRQATPRTRRLAPAQNAAIHDLIMTPPELAQQIVDAYAPRGRLLDPCRGAGAFHDALRRHSDDVRWCEITEGVDFFSYREPVDWIITNPPWSKFRPFLQHAMQLAPNIVFLGTLVHFVTKARLRDMDHLGFGISKVLLVDQPPPPWPGSGFQPCAALVRKGARSLFDVMRAPAPLLEIAP